MQRRHRRVHRLVWVVLPLLLGFLIYTAGQDIARVPPVSTAPLGETVLP
ncbi:MAG: hypothetical protein AAF918_02475 [Pseudomonadota bacterium]